MMAHICTMISSPCTERSALSQNIIIELIRIIPSVVWSLIVAGALIAFGNAIRIVLIPRLSGFKAFGVEASFVKETLDVASKSAPAGDDQSRSAVARRANRIAGLVASAEVLIVNDVPA